MVKILIIVTKQTSNCLWDVEVGSDNHVHCNKYLSSLEYHSWLGKLSVPEEHQRKPLL
jgi:hypothetical protein